MTAPFRAPPGCAHHCYDETDCSNVAICRAVAELYGVPMRRADFCLACGGSGYGPVQPHSGYEESCCSCGGTGRRLNK